MNLPWIIILIAIFGLVYSASAEAFRYVNVFSSNRLLISACVAALSALGMWVYFDSGRETTQRRAGAGELDGILLPYVTLAIALVILVLFALLRRLVWFGRGRWKRFESAPKGKR